DVRFQSATREAARGFESEQPATDHGCALRFFGIFRDAVAIIERAEDEHPLFHWGLGAGGWGILPLITAMQSCERRNKSGAASCDHKLVVCLDNITCPEDQLRGTIDSLDTHARVQGDVVFLVPGQGIDEDVLCLMRAREDTRQQNAVVVAIWFIT